MANQIKHTLLASAAIVLAGAPLAHALEPEEYVRICDAYGTGFFYIPGTETCLKIGGYVRADYLDGPDYSVKGFTYEPQIGVLQNPLFDLDVDTDGERVSVGFSIRSLAASAFGEERFFRSFTVEADMLEVEGRAFASRQMVTAFGIPGVGTTVGQAFGFGTQVDVESRAYVEADQWGIKAEAAFNPFALTGGGISFGERSRTSLSILAGMRYSETDTETAHYADILGGGFTSSAEYHTDIDEQAFTPYLGLSLHNSFDTGLGRLHFGISGRVGVAFIGADIADMVSSTAPFTIMESAEFNDDAAVTYGSIGGMIGVETGPLKISLHGALERGALNDSHVFRPGSDDGAPGVPVEPEYEVNSPWTKSVGARLTYSF